MKIGIIVAMDKELNQLQALFNDGNVRVEKCGIGKVNAALGAQRMINEFHPDCIIRVVVLVEMVMISTFKMSSSAPSYATMMSIVVQPSTTLHS